MTNLILGLAIFFAMHLLPTFTTVRNALYLKLGKKGYKGLFALISFVGLYFIVVGKGAAAFIPIWEPPSWSYVITNISMVVALYFIVAMHMKSNIRRFTAHPMLWGITFWSCGHLATNGDQASMILFGSFLAYSLFDMVSANRRGARPEGKKVSIRYDAIIAVISTIGYVVLANLHPYFTGITLVR